MNKIARYLQEHLDGEVSTATSARRFFSTDASVLEVAPLMIVYPHNKNDVRKVARFSWQLAEKGHALPITPRGKGTDLSGAAIGHGIVLAFPAHMSRLLEMDTKQKLARFQPGINFRGFQEAMQTHGLFLPAYPASIDYSTVGGALANNSAGEKSIKYGDIRAWTDQLEIVLANGEIIHTGRLSKRELSKKKGLQTLEGEIYRQVDGIITDNWDRIQQVAAARRVSKNSSGYELAAVKHKDGSFDLTPLIVGSQGTLAIITEAIVRLAPYAPQTDLFVLEFTALETAQDAIDHLIDLGPSALEMVDRHLLEFVQKTQPDQLKGLISDGELPAIVLLVEFDDVSEHLRRKKVKRAKKYLSSLDIGCRHSADYEEQVSLWTIRHSAAAVVNYNEAHKTALPIIEDGIVPRSAFLQYIEGVYDLLNKYHLEVALWGHAGDANLHIQPFFDLSKLGDRQKVFKLMNDYHDLVLRLGGSIAAEHNDGRLRAPFAIKQHGEDMMEIFQAIKKAFDPYNTLNPGVKLNTDIQEVSAMLRREYSIAHLSDNLPTL